MKLKVLMTVAVLLLSTSAAFGQSGSITVDLVTGLEGTSTDTFALGGDVRFYIRLTNNFDTNMTGMANGFRVYSEDGATWGTIVGDTIGPLGKNELDGGLFIETFSVTGAGADTIGFGGFVFFNVGLADGFDDTAYSITIGPIQGGSNAVATTICVDSAFYRPTGIWKWASKGDVENFPTWGGPYCYFVPPDPSGVRSLGDNNLPTSFALGQNYPNPFNPTTQIAFDLPVRSQVELKVYNVLGQEVTTLVNEKLSAGSYEADWDGRSNGGSEVASGIYFYRLHTEAFTQTKKMILLK